MRFLKPALVVAATASIVAAGAATSFAMSGTTAPSLNSTSSTATQLSTTANGAERPVLGDSTASAPRGPAAVAPQVPSGASGSQLSRQDAIEAVLSRASLSTAAVGGTVVRVERAQEQAGLVWKVRLNTDAGTRDYVVNATTGAVMPGGSTASAGVSPQLTSNSAMGDDDGANG